jgi:hypothetical protein
LFWLAFVKLENEEKVSNEKPKPSKILTDLSFDYSHPLGQNAPGHHIPRSWITQSKSVPVRKHDGKTERWYHSGHVRTEVDQSSAVFAIGRVSKKSKRCTVK